MMRSLGPRLLQVAVPVAILALWWVFSERSTSVFYPPLAQILERFRDLWVFDHVFSDIVPTLAIMLAGFACAVIGGVVSGLVLAISEPARSMAMPVLTFFRALPGVALIPVFVQVLGFGDGVRVLIVALAALPATLLATLDGVMSVDATLKQVGAVYGIPRRQRWVGLLIPAAMPRIFAGIQVSLQFAFIAVIASEMVGATRGIGYLTLYAQQTFATADMWAGVLLLGGLGFVLNGLLMLVRRRVLRWYDRSQQIAKQA